MYTVSFTDPCDSPFQRPCSLQHCTPACSVRKYTVLKSRSALATRDAKHKSVQMNYNPFRQLDTTTTIFLFLKRTQQLFFEILWHSIFQGKQLFCDKLFMTLSLSFNYSLRFRDLLSLRQQLFCDKLFMALSLLIILWDSKTFYLWCNKCFLINFLALSF